jgi:predicted RNA polymerase sigma factor
VIIELDRVDWERVYRQAYPSVYRALVATLFDLDLAADALEDAFVAGLDRPPLHDANIPGWLFHVAIRKAGRARRPRTLSLDAVAKTRAPASPIDHDQRLGRVTARP